MRELERGRVRFYVRPRVGMTSVLGFADVQSFSFTLQPRGGAPARVVRVGKKRMPDDRRRERCWAHVARVGTMSELLEGFGERTYETKTRGIRHQAAAIEVARGDYIVAGHDDHAHFLYVLDPDDEPSPLSSALKLAPPDTTGGCIAAVFNPEAKWRIRDHEQPETPFREPSIFEDEVQERFGDRRFAPLEPMFLDHEGTELVLIGTKHEPSSRSELRASDQKRTPDPSLRG